MIRSPDHRQIRTHNTKTYAATCNRHRGTTQHQHVLRASDLSKSHSTAQDTASLVSNEYINNARKPDQRDASSRQCHVSSRTPARRGARTIVLTRRRWQYTHARVAYCTEITTRATAFDPTPRIHTKAQNYARETNRNKSHNSVHARQLFVPCTNPRHCKHQCHTQHCTYPS